MRALNAKGAEVGANRKFRVHSATDITGFGLIGHLRGMARGSDVSMRIDAARIPLLEGAIDCVRAGAVPGGLTANREFAECVVGYESAVSEDVKTLLFDPQTAGGLLLSVAGGDPEALLCALLYDGVHGVAIGEVLPAAKPLIKVG